MGFIHCNLRVLMAERGLNIQQVKDKTTLSRTTISNLYNNNVKGIQFDTLKQLCELLKCKTGDLIIYVDIEVDFKAVAEVKDVTMEEKTHIIDENNGYEYISKIDVVLDLRCKLHYEGKNHQFIFPTKVSYGIDERKNIYSIDIGLSPHFEFSIDRLEMPTYAESYVYNKFEIFLVDWGLDYFGGNEIEDVSDFSVDYYGFIK